MPGEHTKGEDTKKHVYSEAQKKFFGAVAGGHPTKPTTMTVEQAKHHIRMGEKQRGKLPSKVGLHKYVRDHER